jgi:hypothetical protein
MSRRRCPSLPAFLAHAAAVFLLPGAFAGPEDASRHGDPLAVGKLEEARASLQFEDAEVFDILRLLARMGEVPFILDFEADPTLRVTFKSEQMSLRTILRSLADTYGLEYEASDAGIVVRRRGAPRARKPITVGAWPPRPGPLYRLELETRDPSGAAMGSPSLVMPAQSLGTLKQGLVTGREVATFDRERLIAEPRYVGIIQLNFCIRKETGAGLDLLLEIVTERPLGEARYAEEHAVVTKTAGPGTTLLFATEDGYQIVLKGWSRAQ